MKLFIAIPAKDQMYSHTTYSLIELVKYCTVRGIEVETSINLGTLVCNQRENLANQFLESKSDYCLWIDSDMLFPPDVFKRLKKWNKDVVACTYSTRGLPLKGVAYEKVHEWDSWVEPNNSTLVEVEAVGMGMFLQTRDSLLCTSQPRFKLNWVEESKDYMGEDFYYCSLLRKAGFPINIDVQLSKEIFHIGSFGYSFNSLKKD